MSAAIFSATWNQMLVFNLPKQRSSQVRPFSDSRCYVAIRSMRSLIRLISFLSSNRTIRKWMASTSKPATRRRLIVCRKLVTSPYDVHTIFVGFDDRLMLLTREGDTNGFPKKIVQSRSFVALFSSATAPYTVILKKKDADYYELAKLKDFHCLAFLDTSYEKVAKDTCCKFEERVFILCVLVKVS